MPNEYQGERFGTVYQSSSNAIDNLLNVSQQNRQQELANNRMEAKQKQDDEKQRSSLDRYAETLFNNKDYKYDPAGDYAPMFNQDITQIKQIVHDLIASGANDGQVATEIQQRMSPVLARMQKYNNVIARTKSNTEAMKGIFEPNELKSAVTKKYFLDENGKPSYTKLDEINGDEDLSNEVIKGGVKGLTIKPFAKPELYNTKLGSGQVRNAKGELVEYDFGARTNPKYFDQIPQGEGKAPMFAIKGSTQTVGDDFKPIMEEVPTGQVDKEGKPVMGKVPVNQLTDDGVSYWSKMYPQLPFAVKKEMELANDERIANGKKPISEDQEDAFMKAMAYKVIEGHLGGIPTVRNDSSNLTQKKQDAVNISEASAKRIVTYKKVNGVYNYQRGDTPIGKEALKNASINAREDREAARAVLAIDESINYTIDKEELKKRKQKARETLAKSEEELIADNLNGKEEEDDTPKAPPKTKAQLFQESLKKNK